jgi:hypothetical protein
MIKKSRKWLSPQYKADATRWGEQKESYLERLCSWLYDNKLVSAMIDPAKAFTNDFLP